jgi:hypothetical protein
LADDNKELADCRLALQRANTTIDELKTAVSVSIIPENDGLAVKKQNEDVGFVVEMQPGSYEVAET